MSFVARKTFRFFRLFVSFALWRGLFRQEATAPCDQWFTTEGLAFPAMNDLEILLLIELIGQNRVTAMRAFVNEGRQPDSATNRRVPVLYRFAKPSDDQFPFMLELFSCSPGTLNLGDGQTIIPVKVEAGHHMSSNN